MKTFYTEIANALNRLYIKQILYVCSIIQRISVNNRYNLLFNARLNSAELFKLVNTTTLLKSKHFIYGVPRKNARPFGRAFFRVLVSKITTASFQLYVEIQ